MKPIVMIISLGAALLVALTSGFDKPWKKWKKALLIASVSVSLALTLLPPIGADCDYAFKIAERGAVDPINVIIDYKADMAEFDETGNRYIIKCSGDESKLIAIPNKALPYEFKSNNRLIIKTLPKKDGTLEYLSTVTVDPLINFAFVWGLEERIKILSLHVPVAWASALAYLISLVYSIIYLRKKDLSADVKASSSAAVGTVFAILTTTTGMLWAKFNWGHFWNWDPRETSIFILLMVYLAYFALRSSLDNAELKARLSAVYAIIAGVAAPFLMFILPRLTAGLHPGSADDTNAGPVLSTQPGMLDSSLLYSFGLGLFAFTLLFFYLLNLSVRTATVKNKINLLN